MSPAMPLLCVCDGRDQRRQAFLWLLEEKDEVQEEDESSKGSQSWLLLFEVITASGKDSENERFCAIWPLQLITDTVASLRSIYNQCRDCCQDLKKKPICLSFFL